MMKINWCDFGLANIIRGKLYVNHVLEGEDFLLDEILNHERLHIEHPNQSLKIDFEQKPVEGLSKFMVKHPSTWLQFFPIVMVRVDKKLMLLYSKHDVILTLVVLIYSAMLVGVFYWVI